MTLHELAGTATRTGWAALVAGVVCYLLNPLMTWLLWLRLSSMVVVDPGNSWSVAVSVLPFLASLGMSLIALSVVLLLFGHFARRPAGAVLDEEKDDVPDLEPERPDADEPAPDEPDTWSPPPDWRPDVPPETPRHG